MTGSKAELIDYEHVQNNQNSILSSLTYLPMLTSRP